MTWKMYGDEKREEGREEEHKKGLEALVQVTFEFKPDFEELYAIIHNKEAYADVTREQVRKYYDPLISKEDLQNQPE